MKSFSLAILLLLISCLPVCGLEQDQYTESRLKAAYLYNFSKFITWPEESFESPEQPLVFTILGDQRLLKELQPIAGKTVQGRPIEVRGLKHFSELKTCHLLYIGAISEQKQREILATLTRQPVVTVGTGKNFAEQGGIFQLVNKRGRLRFVINLAAAQQNHISIQAQLLTLALEVRENR